MDLFIASCRELPEPDLDAAPLESALLGVGITSQVVPWDDPKAPWSDAPAILIRSTWNYPHHPEAFMDWLSRVSATAPMWNPADIVRWNVHKGYLNELAEAGLPVTPTVLVRRGSEQQNARDWTGHRVDWRCGARDLALGDPHMGHVACEERIPSIPYARGCARCLTTAALPDCQPTL